MALLVAPALALVIAVGCGSDDPAGETAVMGATLDRPSEGTQPADRPIDAGSRPRQIVAESTDRAAPVVPSDALRIGGVRVVAESTDRVRPADSPRIVAESTDRTPPADVSQVVGDRYSGQAAAGAAADRTPPSDGSEVVEDRYAGQAEAYEVAEAEADRPIRVNGGRTEE